MNIVYLILGWLLGLCSPLIVERIRAHYREKELRKCFQTELIEARQRLLFLTYKLSIEYGNYDRDLLTWLKPILGDYEGPLPTLNIKKQIEEHLKLTDEELLQASEHVKEKWQGMGLSLKTLNLHFIDSHINDMSVLDAELLNKILDIKTRIHFMNESINMARFYYEKTFDSNLTDENHLILNKNLNSTYEDIGEMARWIVDKITTVLSCLRVP